VPWPAAGVANFALLTSPPPVSHAPAEASSTGEDIGAGERLANTLLIDI